MIADLLFYLFAGTLLLGATGVITARNPMHCVLFMVLAFFNAAGLFLLLGAEFLGLLMVMVYVGAIAMLFLFVIMTINIDKAVAKEGFIKELPLGLIVGAILAVEMVLAVSGGLFGGVAHSTNASMGMNAEVQNIVQLGDVLFTNYAYPFITVSLILLVAMVGAIVLTHRKRPDAKRQNIAKQIARTREEAVTLTTPESGRGI